MNSEATFARIKELYESQGGNHYGEQITQTEHAVQCGRLAIEAGYGEEVAIAAFLHDVGHLIVDELPKEERTGALLRHQELGAQWLRERGFSDRVVSLVNHHVDGKRYLTAVDEHYFAGLSEASVESLGFQGGPMSRREIQEFEAMEDFDLHVAFRRWDDHGKDVAHKDDDMTPYFDMIGRHLGL